MQPVPKGVGVAGATLLGFAGDWSLWQESKDGDFCFLHLPPLEAGHAVGVLFMPVHRLLCHDLIILAPASSEGWGRWDKYYHLAGEHLLAGPIRQALPHSAPGGSSWLLTSAEGTSEEGGKPQARTLVTATTEGGAADIIGLTA